MKMRGFLMPMCPKTTPPAFQRPSAVLVFRSSRAGDEAYVHGELQRLRQDRSKFLDDFIPDGKWRAGSGSPPLSTRLFWIWDGELFMRGPHPSDRPDQIKLYFWLRPGVVV